MSEKCRRLHEALAVLPVVDYPFSPQQLPMNGIYFFYEKGESWGHGGDGPRIVRVGTHREGNFRSRIAEHYLSDSKRITYDVRRPAPHERSIFRKNLGRALLNRESNPYLTVWELDFTSRASREKSMHLRDLEIERRIEDGVTRLLREAFSFRFIALTGQAARMGSAGLESRLIGTLAQCRMCRPSAAWLGLHSPKAKIRESGLWLSQHLTSPGLTEQDWSAIRETIHQTRAEFDGLPG